MEASSLFIRLIGFFLIIIVGLTLGHLFSSILKKVLKGMEVDKILKKQLKIKFSLESRLVSLLKYFIYALAAIIALTELGLPTSILKLIFFIILGITLLFLLFSFKDWIPSVLAGLYIIHTKKIKRGDTIKTQGFSGTVKKVSLLETEFRSKTKEKIFMPNSLLMRQELRIVKGGK